MFATLFKRAEASVDNAIGDLGNRVIVALPFLVAIGLAASSLSIVLNRMYGPEVGNLILAGAFLLLGCVVAIVVMVRSNSATQQSADDLSSKDETTEPPGAQSIFDDESVMAVVSAAAPIVIPAVLRTGMKNWPLLLAAAAGLYVFSRSEATAAPPQQPPSA